MEILPVSLIIDLTPSEEARLVAAAKETGVDAAELAKRLVTAHLPAVAGDNEPEPKQGKSEGQNGAEIVSDAPTQELFAKWAQEDALLTEAERAESDRIYAELEKAGIPRIQI
jgi:hypothetical protein